MTNINKCFCSMIVISMTSILEASKFPTVNQLGIINKWLSDPPSKGPWKATINDKRFEVLRVEDRINTPAYSPNFNILSVQNCFAINFEWPSERSLPTITMSLKTNKHCCTWTLRKGIALTTTDNPTYNH